jgi:peptidoglycan/LPS O-acetylase OafA/YrhL
MSAKYRYIPEIDGLRAVSILLVFAAHGEVQWIRGGELGVDIFFVISGYLITSVLLAEHIKSGVVDIKAFYLRRILRIVPAFAFFLLAYLALTLLVVTPGNRTDHLWALLYASTYVMNWTKLAGLPSSALGHTWSLAVEEHFYLVWPIIFATLAVLPKPRLIVACIGLILIAFAWQAWVALQDGMQSRLYFGSDTRAIQLFIGCLLAVLPTQAICPIASKTWFIPAAVLCLLAITGRVPLRWWDIVSPFVIAASAAWLIAAVIGNEKTVLSAILKARGCVAIGRLSYSLYLWHVPIIVYLANRGMVSDQWRPLVALLLSLAAAAFSYFVIERPFLRLKRNVGTSPRRVEGAYHGAISIPRVASQTAPAAEVLERPSS